MLAIHPIENSGQPIARRFNFAVQGFGLRPRQLLAQYPNVDHQPRHATLDRFIRLAMDTLRQWRRAPDRWLWLSGFFPEPPSGWFRRASNHRRPAFRSRGGPPSGARGAGT